MSRAKHPRVAWYMAAALTVAAASAPAQPRRGQPANTPAASTPADNTPIPTVPEVAANVCIAPEARARALECPAGSGHYGTHRETAPPAAARATGPERNRPATQQRASFQLDPSVLRRRQAERRSRDILVNEARLTATLVQRMNRNDSHRPDALMRLAEDYGELATMDNGAAEDLEENIHQARTANNTAQVQTLQRQQETLRTQARQWREQLITAFRALVQDHPNYPQMDRALFSLAFAYQEANNFNEARTVYRTLIQRFPNSPFVPNAYLSFAEYFFDQGEMENARQFYERVLQVQDESNQVYGYALYKMAWVQFNLQDFQASLQRFFDVIEYGRNHPNAPSVTPLLRNARMELVAVYGQVYGTAQRPLNPANAFNTFQRYAADENNAFEMFEKLAELYHDGGQWPNSIATYHALMERRPNSDRFCVWQAQVARAVVAGRASNPDRMTEVQRLLDVYETYRSSNRPQEAKNECRNHAARVAFDVASHWHLEAVGRSAEGQQQTRGTRSPETMRLTGELYQKILDTFPDLDQVEFTEYDRRDWPSRYRIAYYRADILRDQGDNEHCGPAYDAVVDMNPQGEFTEDASYKAVLCYNDWFQSQFQVQRNPTANARGATPGRGRQQQQSEAAQLAERRRNAVPRDFNQMEQAMLRAFTRYACFVQPGQGPQQDAEGQDVRTVLLTIKYRRAYLYYNAHKYEEAATLFREVAHSDQAAPDPENLREIAGDLYLDSLNVMGELWNPQRPACYDEMARELPELMGIFCTAANRTQHEDFCHRVEELQCQVLRKKAETLGTSGRHREAAAEYVGIVRAHRECGRLDEMLYNAAIEYDAAFLLGRAMRVRERLVQVFLPRNSPWAQRALYRLAGNYHAIQVFSRAAELYEQYAEYVAGNRATAIAAANAAAQASHTTPEDPVQQAADAMRQATIFRIGLGEEDRALANAQRFARLFGSDPNRRRVAANVVFSIGQIYADRVARLRRQETTGSEARHDRDRQIRTAWSDLVRHYEGFMRTWAAQGTLDQKIQGAVALARGYWGTEDFRRAEQYFQQAVDAWGTAAQGQQPPGERTIREQLGDEAGDAVEKSRDAVAEAKFYLAELVYRRFMAQRVPTYNGGARRAAFDSWNTRTFTPYIQNRMELVQQASRLYQGVMEMHVPNWEIAGAYRLANMYYQFAVTIRTAPVPPDVQRNPDLLDAWNVLRDERTQPFVNTASTGFQACIQRATQVHWFNEWSQSCERELNEIDRNRFPLADEIRVQPTLVFSRPVTSRAVYELQTSADTEDEPAASGSEQQAN